MKTPMPSVPLPLPAGAAIVGDFGGRMQTRFERRGDRIGQRLDWPAERSSRRRDRRH